MSESREGGYLAETGGAHEADFLRFLAEAEDGERTYQGQFAVQRSYRAMRTQLWRDATAAQMRAWAEQKVRQGDGHNIEDMLRVANSLHLAAQAGNQGEATSDSVADRDHGDEQVLSQMREIDADQREKEEVRYRNIPHLRANQKFLKRSLDSLDRQGMAFDDNTPLHKVELTLREEIKKRDVYSARKEDLEKIFESQPMDLVELGFALADLKARRDKLSSRISVLDEARRQKLIPKQQSLNDLVAWVSASARQAEVAAQEARTAEDQQKETLYQQRSQLLRQLESIVEAWIKSRAFDSSKINFSKAVDATRRIVDGFNDTIEDLEDVLLLEKWKQDGVINEDMTLEQAKKILANKILTVESDIAEVEENRKLINQDQGSVHGGQD